jgi:hypothetical protein
MASCTELPLLQEKQPRIPRLSGFGLWGVDFSAKIDFQRNFFFFCQPFHKGLAMQTDVAFCFMPRAWQ